jgi:hypothetical protein
MCACGRPCACGYTDGETADRSDRDVRTTDFGVTIPFAAQRRFRKFLVMPGINNSVF